LALANWKKVGPLNLDKILEVDNNLNPDIPVAEHLNYTNEYGYTMDKWG